VGNLAAIFDSHETSLQLAGISYIATRVAKLEKVRGFSTTFSSSTKMFDCGVIPAKAVLDRAPHPR
jgi:hypothetical protein